MEKKLLKALKGIIQCCDGNTPEHEQIYHIANDVVKEFESTREPDKGNVAQENEIVFKLTHLIEYMIIVIKKRGPLSYPEIKVAVRIWLEETNFFSLQTPRHTKLSAEAKELLREIKAHQLAYSEVPYVRIHKETFQELREFFEQFALQTDTVPERPEQGEGKGLFCSCIIPDLNYGKGAINYCNRCNRSLPPMKDKDLNK